MTRPYDTSIYALIDTFYSTYESSFFGLGKAFHERLSKNTVKDRLAALNITTAEEYANDTNRTLFSDLPSFYDTLFDHSLNELGLTKALSEDEKQIGVPYLKNMPPELVQDLGAQDVSVRLLNNLRGGDMRYVYHLRFWSEKDLVKIKNFGKKSLKELQGLLSAEGSADGILHGYLLPEATKGTFLKKPFFKDYAEAHPVAPRSSLDLLRESALGLKPREQALLIHTLEKLGLEITTTPGGNRPFVQKRSDLKQK